MMKQSYIYVIMLAAAIALIEGCTAHSKLSAELSTPDTAPSKEELFVPASTSDSVSKSTSNLLSGNTKSETESKPSENESETDSSGSDTAAEIYYSSKAAQSESSSNMVVTESHYAEQKPTETSVTYEYYEEKTVPPDESESENESELDIKPTLEISLNSTSIAIGQTAVPMITFDGALLLNNDCTLYSSDDSVLEINEDGGIYAVSEGVCTLSVEHEGNTASVGVTVYDDENDDPDLNYYVDGILIVNKKYYINARSDPGGLSEECVSAFERLTEGAEADGISIYALSDYRSYSEQEQIYSEYVAIYGYDGANALCALPGHSEHQTGLAIDCATYESSYFPGTAAAAWLDEHCAEYGFIIRYPYGKDQYTGYGYEPWHIRYIGSAAQDIQNSGLSLEEYFGLY